MKPPDSSPSSAAASDMSDMSDITRMEQPLLQAARDLPASEPAPALDAALLGAAASRAAKIRHQRFAGIAPSGATPTSKAPEISSALARFARWIFGEGEMPRTLGYALAACAFIGIALGLVLHANRDLSPVFPKGDVVAMQESEPEDMPEAAPAVAAPAVAAPSITTSAAMPESAVLAEERGARMAENKAADASVAFEFESARLPPEAKRSIASPSQLEAEADRPARRLAAPSSPAPEGGAEAAEREAPADAAARQRSGRQSWRQTHGAETREAADSPQNLGSASAVVAPTVAPAATSAPPVPAARASAAAESTSAAPAPVPAEEYRLSRSAGSSREEKLNKRSISEQESEKTPEADIDAELKRFLDLRRAGKEEEAELSIKQLRAKYPDHDIDERLRQLEGEERK